MRIFIEILAHSLLIIWGVVLIILSKKFNFKKQKKGYEIDPKVFNNIVNSSIKSMGYVSIVCGFISIFYNGILMSIVLPFSYLIIIISMSNNIKRVAKSNNDIN